VACLTMTVQRSLIVISPSRLKTKHNIYELLLRPDYSRWDRPFQDQTDNSSRRKIDLTFRLRVLSIPTATQTTAYQGISFEPKQRGPGRSGWICRGLWRVLDLLRSSMARLMTGRTLSSVLPNPYLEPPHPHFQPRRRHPVPALPAGLASSSAGGWPTPPSTTSPTRLPGDS